MLERLGYLLGKQCTAISLIQLNPTQPSPTLILPYNYLPHFSPLLSHSLPKSHPAPAPDPNPVYSIFLLSLDTLEFENATRLTSRDCYWEIGSYDLIARYNISS